MSGYVYRGAKPDLGLDFEQVNAAILAARQSGATGPALDVRRDGWCRNGRRYTAENTAVTPRGTRKCRACARIGKARHNRQKAGIR